MEQRNDMPKKTIYSVPEMAARKGLSTNLLYEEINEGRLKARKRRGAKRGWMLTEEIFNEWWNDETETA